MSKLSFLISSGELFSSRKAPQSWSSLAALRPVLMVSGLAVGASAAMAGPGFVDATLNNGASTRLQTYYANSPAGQRVTPVSEAAGQDDTGAALRKFVDPLPLVGEAKATALSADAAAIKYLPQAVATKWKNPMGVTTTDDYIELAVVEYQEKFHSDLANKTTLRGFVQIDVEASNGRASNIAGSKQVPLIDAQGNALTLLATDANGKLVKDAAGKYVKVPALAVDNPHYLGPVVNATTGVPMRVKLHNLLPVGRAVVDNTGASPVVTQRRGDHFLPYDATVTGAGLGPDGLTSYTQNRVTLHVQGIDAPWISAGSPHQWFTPAGEGDATIPGSLAAEFAADPSRDPAFLAEFLRGVSAAAVPDMNEPGPGAMTYYFANQQGARMLWANDRTQGMARLNTYAGMVLPYIVTDAAEQQMVADGLLPPAERTLPLILQDRTFVPKDIALQDGKWNTTAWGGESSLWYPHVYEPLSDPQFENNWNPVGRWLYGPTFWPIFPALYALPDGAYPNPSFTPEAFFDTPVINGVAYPTMEVEPTTYRLRIVNASNERWMTFNLFEGKVTAQLADGTPVTNPLGIASEVDMMQATLPAAGDACADGQMRPSLDATTGKWCVPVTWPWDSRPGGVAAPAGAGPSLFQFANEAGLLAKVAELPPTPLFYTMDKGRITVMSPETPTLFLSPGDVADVVVDFSQYAGKSLVVYNDAGGPEPGADPRNFYYTGVGDQSSAGGAEDTKPGYGPNLHTMMQFRVKTTGATPAWTPDALNAAVGSNYVASQERPVVAQPDYAAFNASWAGIPLGPASQPDQATAYADIYTTTLKNPYFSYVPGQLGSGFNSIQVLNRGSGYTQAPTVTVSQPNVAGGVLAKATASLKIKEVKVLNMGSGYTSAPTATVAVPVIGLGSGALVDARLTPNQVTMVAGGTGYNQAAVDAAIAAGTFARFSVQPGATAPTVRSATVSATGGITAITLNLNGGGYTIVPTMTITGGGGSGARGSVLAGVGAVHLVAPYPIEPDSAGGGGYTDLTQLTVNFSGGGVNPTAPTVELTGEVFEISLTDVGTGYTQAPTVTLSQPQAAGGVLAVAKADTDALNTSTNGQPQGRLLAKAKSIQELWEPAFGRYNSTQGVELPYTTAYTQTTIPLNYVDTPTELINEGDTQVWKYVHNGLFLQAIEFSGYNVQVVNRVGWDGFVVPPVPNEIGWKSILRVNPLEDAIIALQPKKTKLPGFALPDSYRLMDPSQPWGSAFGFTQFDTATGLAAPVVNDYVDFRHEGLVGTPVGSRNAVDFQRPVIFDAKEGLPLAPTGVTADASGKVSWTDATPATAGNNVAAEVGFRIQVGTPGSDAYTDVATDLRSFKGLGGAQRGINTVANVTEFQVEASAPANLPSPSTPNMPFAGAVTATDLQLRWTLPTSGAGVGATPVSGFRILRAQVAADGIAVGAFVDVNASQAAISLTRTNVGTRRNPIWVDVYSYTDTGVAPGTQYAYQVVALGEGSGQVTYRVLAVNAVGETASTPSQPVAVAGSATPAISAQSNAIATPLARPVLSGNAVQLSEVNASFQAAFNFGAVSGASAYVVQYALTATPALGNQTVWTTIDQTSFPLSSAGGQLSTQPMAVPAGSYVSFRVYAVSPNSRLVAGANEPIVSATVTSNSSFVGAPGVPGVTVAAITANSIRLNLGATNATGYQVKVATSAADLANALWQNVTGNSFTINAAASTEYFYQVQALNGGLTSAASVPASSWTLAAPVAAMPTASNLTDTGLTLNWAAGGATSYTVERATNANFTRNLVITTGVTAGSLDVVGLTANTRYFFRVVALNGAGTPAQASPVLSEVTMAKAPTAVAGINGRPGGPVTAGLNFAGGVATTYNIRWADNSGMVGATSIVRARNATQYPMAGVAASNTANVWMQLQAVNSANVAGAWTPASPIPVIAR